MKGGLQPKAELATPTARRWRDFAVYLRFKASGRPVPVFPSDWLPRRSGLHLNWIAESAVGLGCHRRKTFCPFPYTFPAPAPARQLAPELTLNLPRHD